MSSTPPDRPSVRKIQPLKGTKKKINYHTSPSADHDESPWEKNSYPSELAVSSQFPFPWIGKKVRRARQRSWNDEWFWSYRRDTRAAGCCRDAYPPQRLCGLRREYRTGLEAVVCRTHLKIQKSNFRAKNAKKKFGSGFAKVEKNWYS